MKKNYSVRLHDEVLQKIKKEYETLQKFLDKCVQEKVGEVVIVKKVKIKK